MPRTGGATITASILVEFHDRYTRDARVQANGGVSLPLSGSLGRRFPLQEDVDRIVQEAEDSDVLR